MANDSVNHIVLSPKELIALNNVIKLGLEAFKLMGYPLFYNCLLLSIYQLIQLSSTAVTLVTPIIGFKEFSVELDVLSKFMRDVSVINYFKVRRS